MSAVPGIRRQARSIRNDERILGVATEIVATDGWAGLLPARVAERSGLSHPAISARFADRSAIGAGVWRDRLAAPVIARLEAVLDAAGLLDGGDADPQRLAEAMQPFVEPDMIMCAAAEVLVENCFDANVKAAVHDTLGQALEQWLTPVPRKLTKANASRRSFIICTAFGVLLEARREEGARVELQTEWDRSCATASPITAIFHRSASRASPTVTISSRVCDATIDAALSPAAVISARRSASRRIEDLCLSEDALGHERMECSLGHEVDASTQHGLQVPCEVVNAPAETGSGIQDVEEVDVAVLTWRALRKRPEEGQLDHTKAPTDVGQARLVDLQERGSHGAMVPASGLSGPR